MSAVTEGGPAHRLVRTLLDTREQVMREWPGWHATTEAVRAYHERAAEMYRQVAETDPGHRHEALFWAAQEREAARLASEPGQQTSTVVVPEEVDGDA